MWQLFNAAPVPDHLPLGCQVYPTKPCILVCRGAQQEASDRSPDISGDQPWNLEALVELEALHTQQQQQVEELRKQLDEGLEGLGIAAV